MSESYHRQIAFEKYVRKCQNCESVENVEVHHKDGNNQNHDIDNLIPLCRACHRRMHGSKAQVEGLLKQLREQLPETSKLKGRNAGETKRMVVHDSVYNRADELADEKGITKKEAIRQMCREGGEDV